MTRYARVYFKVIDRTFYKFLNNKRIHPEIVLFENEPRILWSKRVGNDGEDNMTTIITSFTREKDEYELDTQLVERAIKEGEERVKIYQSRI